MSYQLFNLSSRACDDLRGNVDVSESPWAKFGVLIFERLPGLFEQEGEMLELVPNMVLIKL